MPKKSRTRASRARVTPSTSANTKASVPRAPRPTASVPIGSPVWDSPPVVPPATPAPRASSYVRSGLPDRRAIRPSRASSLPMITDYHYVLDDLRRVGILAALAFLVLIGLTFVIH